LRIGFFATPLISDSPRGTSSVARSLVSEISKREGIELFAIFNKQTLNGDNLGNYFTAKQFYNVEVNEVSELARQSWGVDPVGKFLGESNGLNNKRILLFIDMTLRNCSTTYKSDPTNYINSKITKYKPLGRYVPTRIKSVVFDLQNFASQKKVSRVEDDFGLMIVDLLSFDLILNFWWFHSVFPNPALEVANVDDFPIVGWVYDLIPLRIENVGGRAIPATIFAQNVKQHIDHSKYVMCISPQVQHDVNTYIKSDLCSNLLPCGIAPDIFDSFSTDHLKRIPGSILIIGSIEPTKNFVRSIAAIEKAINLGSKVSSLSVIGPCDPDIEKKVRPIISLGVDVTIHGSVTEAKKMEILCASEVLLYPSLFEGFGIPVIEALAMGTKIVSGNVGIPEVTNLENVVIVDPYSVNSIADGIERLLMESDIPKSFESDIELIKSYNWKSITSILLDKRNLRSK
jgi:glycosyltransferase involved in cell wall biosynthesis